MKKLLSLITALACAGAAGQTTKTIPDADNLAFGDGSQASGDFYSEITSGNSPVIRFGNDALTVVDAAGNEIGVFIPAGTAVNHLQFGSAATGNGPTLSAVGDDANVSMNLTPKGTGSVVVAGDILPDADSTRSIGADANRFANGYFDAQDVTTVNTAEIVLLDGAGIKVEGDPDALADDTYQAFKVISGRNAGEDITQWDLVYLNVADGEWHQADADESTAAGKAWGIAATAGTDGNPLDVIVSGIIRNDGWTWSAAAVDLYVSTTAGEMTETAPSTTGDVVKIVARTLSDDEIYLDVTNHFIISD